MRYKNLIFILSLLVFLLPSNTVGENPKYIESMTNIAEYLSTLNKSVNIVLAIDKSFSMKNETYNGTQLADQFLGIIKNKIDGQIKIGYIIWSNITLSKSDKLYSASDNILLDFNKIDPWGNTCLKVALDDSIKLLNNDPNKDAIKVIIIISDGVENCNLKDGNFNCTRYKEKNGNQDILIYSIQIKDGNEIPLLNCLKKPSERSNFINNQSKNHSVPKITKNFNETIEKTILMTKSNDVFRRDLNTNMTVTKSVSKGFYGPHITIRLAAPNVEALKTNIVIALDSSGSMGRGGSNEYGNSIRDAMPAILRKIYDVNRGSNVSILSWDDNIDFSYSPLIYEGVLNNNTSKTSLVPISTAIREINSMHIFKNNTENETILQKTADFLFGKSYPNDYYHCDETELTDLNQGLEGAREILNNTAQNRLDGTLKLILLIVGRSEYIPCKTETIYKAKQENCNIHTIGLGVSDKSKLKEDLIKIAGDKKALNGDRDKYHYSTGSHTWSEASVEDAINASLGKYFTENLTDELIVVDTLYSYLEPINGTINTYTYFDNKEKYRIESKKELIENEDESTTLRIVFNKGFHMKPGQTVEISFDTSLNLSLPVDLTISNKDNKYISNIMPNTSPSYISYKWLGNERIYKVYLPECGLFTDRMWI